MSIEGESPKFNGDNARRKAFDKKVFSIRQETDRFARSYYCDQGVNNPTDDALSRARNFYLRELHKDITGKNTLRS